MSFHTCCLELSLMTNNQFQEFETLTKHAFCFLISLSFSSFFFLEINEEYQIWKNLLSSNFVRKLICLIM